MCGSMVGIQSATAEIRRGKKERKKEEEKEEEEEEEEDRNHREKYNGMPYSTGRP